MFLFQLKLRGLTTLLLGLCISLVILPQVLMAKESDKRKTYNKNSIYNQVIYFVMPDRFFNGDTYNDYGNYTYNEVDDPNSDQEVLKHGYKKDDKGYFHGGDFKGLTNKLPYLKQMGVTTIWITPIFKNKPVQGDGTIGGSSAGYHGYWITDFTKVDPHLGANQDLLNLVNGAHAIGMKVIFDIITNHTADVIQYSDNQGLSYRSKKNYPYVDVHGQEFDDLDYAFSYRDNTPFPQLDNSSFPFEVFVSETEKDIKNPAWLNNPLYYHNRGNTTFSGENSVYGDFSGLDDLFTAHPKVVSGMIDIYKQWIRDFRIDGFRIDTVRHVNMTFWQQFIPEIMEYAKSLGKENFYVFGEVADSNPVNLSLFTTEGTLPAVLDFGFQSAALSIFNGGAPTNNLRDFFAHDDYYIDADSNAYMLPTFLGNHDMGRVGAMIARDHSDETEDQILARLKMAHLLLFTSRGVPTIYYGDEQGFTGINNDNDIHDKIARQDMFETAVDSYSDPVINNQIGTDATPGQDNFNTRHPLYRFIRVLSQFRKIHPAFQKGSQLHRYSSSDENGGIYAFSRILRGRNRENIVVINSNPSESKTGTIKTLHKKTLFKRTLAKEGDSTPKYIRSNTEGELTIEITPLSGVIYKALQRLPRRNAQAPQVEITRPTSNYESGAFWIQAELAEDDFVEVDFYVNEPNKGWRFIGKDDNAPYRVHYNSSQLPIGSYVDIKVVATNYAYKSSTALRESIRIENRIPQVTVKYENGNNHTSVFAISSKGRFIFPQETNDQGITFSMQEGEDAITLYYETKDDNGFKFDTPIHLSLEQDIYPFTVQDSTGGLQATLFVNNIRQLANKNNFIDSPKPEMLPHNVNAPNPVSEALYIRGGLNGWSTDNELEYQGNYTYLSKAVLQPGNMEFKFADENWSVFNFGAPLSENGITLGTNPGNLLLDVPDDAGGSYFINFFYYPSDTTPNGYYGFYRFERDDENSSDLFETKK